MTALAAIWCVGPCASPEECVERARELAAGAFDGLGAGERQGRVAGACPCRCCGGIIRPERPHLVVPLLPDIWDLA